MFDFFKRKEEIPDWRKKVPPPVYLTDYLKQQLFNLIAGYTQLSVSKTLNQDDSNIVKTFINDFDIKVNSLKETNIEPTGWITLPDVFLSSLNYAEKKRVVEILQPFRELAVTHLKMITSDYDVLMSDVKKHKVLAKEYAEIRKDGGHIKQNREFISYWINNISPQWFGIAHFVEDLKIN
jgi:hypothetical protein